MKWNDNRWHGVEYQLSKKIILHATFNAFVYRGKFKFEPREFKIGEINDANKIPACQEGNWI